MNFFYTKFHAENAKKSNKRKEIHASFLKPFFHKKNILLLNSVRNPVFAVVYLVVQYFIAEKDLRWALQFAFYI